MTIPRHILVHTLLPSVGIGIVSLAAYSATLTPGVTFIDSGELATVATTLGVAHPTGYPLFTILGWLVAHLPLGSEPIVRLNFFAAVCSAGGTATLFLAIRRVLAIGATSGDEDALTVAAVGGASLTAFSETYWSQALAIEVYPLHCLLVALVLLTFLRAAFPLHERDLRGGTWSLFAFLVGLSFTNHMTTILLAPGLIVMYFASQGFTRASWRRLGRMAIPFALGISLYLYLPVRASQEPLFCWGNPVDADRLFAHAFGKQYRIWIFESAEVAGRQLSHFLSTLPGEMGVAGLLLALAGLVLLWHRHRVLGLGMTLLFAGCVAYSINYDIKDIDAYFLLAYIVLGVWTAVGLHAAAVKSLEWGRRGFHVVGGATLALCTVLLANTWSAVDRSGDHLVEDYTRNMFASVDSGSVVLSYQWDFWVSSSYYQQYVRGVRQDITVIDKELLRRSWYLLELGRRVPWLMDNTRTEVQQFLAAVAPFEHDRPYIAAVIEARYQGMIAAMIRESMKRHRVYVTGEIEPQYTQGYWRVPAGLAFRLSTSRETRLDSFPKFAYRPLVRPGRLEDMVKSLYSDAYLSRAEYALMAQHDTSEARKSLENGEVFNIFSPRRSRLVSMLQTP